MILLPKLIRSIGIGFSGIGQVLRSEQNMRVHLLCALVTIGAGFWLKIARWEWAAVLIAIGFVLAAECFNTALEQLANRVTTEQDDLVRRAKDAAAAAVLLASLTALAIGLLVFLPKLLTLNA